MCVRRINRLVGHFDPWLICIHDAVQEAVNAGYILQSSEGLQLQKAVYIGAACTS